MAQNTPEVYEDPTQIPHQIKRRVSNSDHNLSKRQRTEGSLDSSPTYAVTKENDEKYVTKEEFIICMERISKIEARLTKIEKTFESLRFAFLGANLSSKNVPSSASSVMGSHPSSSNSSNRTPISAVKPASSSAMNLPHEAPAPSAAKSAQPTPSAADKTAQPTTLSVVKSTQSAPLSAVKSVQALPASAPKPAQRTPLSSASKSIQQTLPSSASKCPQGTPPTSATKSAQVTPVSSTSNLAEGTPLSSAAMSPQVTPVSSTAKSAHGTPVSSAKSSYGTPPSAPKAFNGTPPSGTKLFQGTSSVFHKTPPSATKPTQGASKDTTSSAATLALGTLSVTNPTQGAPTPAMKSRNVETLHDDADITIIQETGPGPSATNVNIPTGRVVTGMKITNAQDKPATRRTNENAGINQGKINVIPQNELLAAHPDHPTPGRNPPSYTQQRARSTVTPSASLYPRPHQPTNPGPSLPKPGIGHYSTHQGAHPNRNEPRPSTSSTDVNDMPEEVFRFIRPKQEIYDNPRNSMIVTPINNQLVAYIDGDSRKKKNHDIFAAVAGFKAGPDIRVSPYVSDITRLNATDSRKLANLVKQQAEVLAAFLVLTDLRERCRNNAVKVKIVARSPKLVQIMKNGFQTIYPSFNFCHCNNFPCGHDQRWETTKPFAADLPDDLPRLILATRGFNVQWCTYTPTDPEERAIMESFKREFKKQISDLLSKNNPR